MKIKLNSVRSCNNNIMQDKVDYIYIKVAVTQYNYDLEGLSCVLVFYIYLLATDLLQ